MIMESKLAVRLHEEKARLRSAVVDKTGPAFIGKKRTLYIVVIEYLSRGIPLCGRVIPEIRVFRNSRAGFLEIIKAHRSVNLDKLGAFRPRLYLAFGVFVKDERVHETEIPGREKITRFYIGALHFFHGAVDQLLNRTFYNQHHARSRQSFPGNLGVRFHGHPVNENRFPPV